MVEVQLLGAVLQAQLNLSDRVMGAQDGDRGGLSPTV